MLSSLLYLIPLDDVNTISFKPFYNPTIIQIFFFQDVIIIVSLFCLKWVLRDGIGIFWPVSREYFHGWIAPK